MTHPLLSDSPGEKHLLLGNEAIVRGAVEAGVDFISCYPGTPSSEAPDTFFMLSPQADYTFEYSVNEKVALEVGGGAALAGARTMVTMKHVGVNVAADPFMTLAYIGVPGGLVLLSADDPGCHSSQNEQDNRYFARLGGYPVFEPASAQEAKDMVREAFELSRKWQQPIMLRTTTRLNHLRGVVEFGPIAKKEKVEGFKKTPGRFVPVPAIARARHVALLENLATIEKAAEESSWITEYGSGKLGVVVSGMSRTYVKDVVEEHGLEDRVKVLELGFSWPLPEERLTRFIKDVDRLMVVEEGEPILETELGALANKAGRTLDILGKGTVGLTRLGEYSTVIVRDALMEALGEKSPAPEVCAAPEGLPNRPPNLCPGCTHRGAYYAVRHLFGEDAVYSTDIGCYTLGILPPLRMADLLLCMGSSISAGSGVSKASGQTVIGFIGDSTFFHSGITGLVNAVYNNHDIILVVLDNHTTAMTGHQPHPGVELSPLGPNESRVDIESIVRGCGVEHIRTASPLNLKSTVAALDELRGLSGVRVLISRAPCPLHAKRTLKQKPGQTAYVAEQTDEVRTCLSELACPAFYVEEEEVLINENQCSGCMLCLQITSDIKARKRS